MDDETSGKKKDVLLMIKQHDKLPLVLKNKLISIVGPEELWEEVSKVDDRALLNKNGGRIIFGYNKSDGLVIRNSISQPLILPGSKTRVHVGPGY